MLLVTDCVKRIDKVVQIWPRRFVCKQVTVCPGHISTTLYKEYTANTLPTKLWRHQNRTSKHADDLALQAKAEIIDRITGTGRCCGIEINVEKQDRQCTYNATLRRVRESLLLGKSNTYYLLVCVCMHAYGYPGTWAFVCAYAHVALLIHHATRMRHVVTSFVALLSLPHFSVLSHKRCDFRKNVTVFSFSLQCLSKTFVILRII
jgi:hypothetical protein